MAPPTFCITASDAAEQHDHDQPQTAATSSVTMLKRVWTVTSNKTLQTLEMNVPGVVFVAYDAALAHTNDVVPAVQAPASASTEPDRVVATIVATSDSQALLDALKAASLDVDKEDEGVQFCVKNENAELRGSLLIQVAVRDKHALRTFVGSTATYVLGDAVMTQSDPDADVKLTALNAGSVFLSSGEGFTLRSLTVSNPSNGVVQVRVPSINVREDLSLSTLRASGKLTVSADTITASEVKVGAVRKGETVVQTTTLTTKHLSAGALFSGHLTVLGAGSATTQDVVIFPSGTVETGGIASEKTSVVCAWSGRARVHDAPELDVTNPLIGSVEVTDKVARKSTSKWWLWWRSKATGGAPDGSDTRVVSAEPLFVAPPVREPVAVHYRVKRRKQARLTRVDTK